ncbi:MAG: glycoside hydrolase family 5 protein [Polyangiaceae bacterium]
MAGLRLLLAFLLLTLVGCSDDPVRRTGGGASGGASGGSATTSSGGAPSSGGSVSGGTASFGGSAAGGSSGGSVSGGTAGTAGRGGAAATGGAGMAGGGGAAGANSTAVDLRCVLNGNTINVPAGDVISDFRQPTPVTYVAGPRGGTEWYAYGAEDSATTNGASTPGTGSNDFSVDASSVGPCGSGGSLHVSSPGNQGATGWGVGFGVNLMADIGTSKRKGQYDAKAAGYTGVGFFMRCTAETDFVYVKLVDAPNDADVQTPVCSYSAAPFCNQYGQKNATLLTEWTYHRVYFSEALQDWDVGTVSNTGLASNTLTAFQLQINTRYTRDGGGRVRNPFSCWIDDVHFLRDPAPSASPNAQPKACTSNASGTAPGGYFVSGNKILDCKTNAVKLFKGIARPSFEWDRAGWNVTYEDMLKIASWKSNAVRVGLNQSYWLDSSKGALYQAYVDRAVKWALSLGMDVILDLHWLTSAQTPSTDALSVTFWGQVAQKYKNDGRVMFELFNEPHDISAAQWKSDMQGLYTAVRNAGANNLVLVGGLDWAYNLAQVLPGNALSGSNIAYVAHPYSFKGTTPSAWDAAFGNLTATYPVVSTEFGQANTSTGAALTCDPNVYSSMLSYFASKGMGWTAWAWYVDRTVASPSETCGFPQLISGYSGSPNPAGSVIKSALAN